MTLALVLLFAGSTAFAETPRERCQTMTEHGARADAIAACDEAVKLSGSAQDMWAAAKVRVARPEAPTMDDLIRADLLAAAATRLAPGEPWGYLARFDLARRWGDAELVERRLDELQRAAPADARTLQAAALVRPSTSWSLLCGWSLLLLLCAVTAAHALKRWLGQRARIRVPAVLLVAVAASLVLGQSRAASAAGFDIDDAQPDRDVPTQAQADARPMDFAYYLQELTQRAEAATSRGDHAAAARYYRAMARAVPDASLPEQKLCASLVALGEHDAAIAACHEALGRTGVRVEDFVRFGDLVLGKSAPTAAELHDVEDAARHLVSQAETRLDGLRLECRLGVRTASVALLEECSAGLIVAAPADAATYVFRWTLAMEKGQVGEARELIARARAAGLGADGLSRMEAATAARAGQKSSRRTLVLAGLAALLGTMLLLMAVVRVARARRTRRGRHQWTTTISGSS